ncbi:30S ribosomal protein S8 [Leptolyngbya sp. 15MV]|nr:30S ribosomal protein S8 [Leptolyngbya sp. 15MV]
MAVSDPIGDMLARIRNATRNKNKTVNCLNSRVCRGVADVLRDEGYIVGYDVIDDGRQGLIRVKLKYGPRGEILFTRMDRQSKPGRRIYSGVDDLPRPMQGLGIAIVSTSRGVMSDRRARESKLGGELLAIVE